MYPALTPDAGGATVEPEQFSTGIEEFDALMRGGVERGTVTVFSGPTGVGKATLATKLLEAVTGTGHTASMYQFEESVATVRHRSEALGIDLSAAGDNLHLEDIEPLALSPEEFAQQVREDVDSRDTDLVVLDGTDGYQLSLHGAEGDVVRSLHALCRYLIARNVTVVLLDQSDQADGATDPTDENFSYLADNIVVLNYIERDGRKERIASVLKKRIGNHEETVRPYSFGADGIEMRAPETAVENFLTGSPTYSEGLERQDDG